jgi:general secretion pathway protein G
MTRLPLHPLPSALVSAPRRQASSRGFTLVEIMVVVVIISLLAAFIVPRVMGRVDDARVTKARADIQAIETALTLYRLDNGRYPPSGEGLAALTESGDYLARVSADPWGEAYRYRFPGTRGSEYDLFSLGPNGVEDASGGDDIGNWNLAD